MKRKKEKRDEEHLDCMTRVDEGLKNGVFVKNGTWSGKDIEFINDQHFLTAKPVVFLVNIGDKQYVKKQNPWLPKIQAYIKDHGGEAMIPYSAEFEAEVVSAGVDDKEAQAAKAKELGGVSMIDRIIKSGYRNLNLVHFMTAGPDEVRCWTIRKGCLAPQAGGVIHTDFQNMFVCADVMKYDDLERLGSEQAVKAEGLYK